MRNKNTVTTNTIHNILTNLVMMLFPLISISYVSRIIGPESIGKIDFIQAMVNYFLLIGGLGLPLYANREISYIKDDINLKSKVFKEIICIHIISIIFFSTIYFLLIRFCPLIFKGHIKIASIMGFLIVTSFLDIKWFFQGINKFNIITKGLFFSRMIQLPLFLIFIREKSDLYLYAILLVVGNLIYYFFMFLDLRDEIKLENFNFKELHIKKHFNFIGYFLIAEIFCQIYSNLDRIMLGWIRGEQEIGYYFAANQLIRKFLPIVTSTGLVLLSKISQLKNENNTEKVKFYLEKSISLTLSFSIPVALGFFLLSNEIILLIFGNTFKSSLTLKILSPIIVLIGLSNIYGVQILLPFGKEKIYTLVIIIGAITNFLLNIILIKEFGCNGAALSVLAAEFIITTIDIFIVYKLIKGIHNLKEISKIFSASILMSFYIVITKSYIFNNLNIFFSLLFIVSSSALLYFLILYILKFDMLKWILEKIKL